MESSPASPPAPAADHARWFAENVQPHEPALRGFLRHQFPGVEADDVLQESYLRLLKIKTAGRITAAKAYVFAVARNTAIRLFQQRTRRPVAISVNDLADFELVEEGPDASEIVHSRQRMALMAEAVARLPTRCRVIVELTILDGLTPAEIARQLSLSENTIRVQLSRGVRKCSAYLRAQGAIE